MTEMGHKTSSSWGWAFVIGGCAVFAYLSFFRKELPVRGLLTTTMSLFVYFFVAYIVCVAVYRMTRSLFQGRKREQDLPEKERENLFNKQRDDSRRNLQNKTNDQVDEYKERILKPREEARQQRKEQKLQNVIGPEFKGHGDALGGEVRLESIQGEITANAASREFRQLPGSVRLHVPASEAKPVKRKRVITLPEEPDEDEADVVMVTIHTILDQRHSRRFTLSTKLKVVFDYMTTLGFSPNVYTLALSYPRRPLTDDAEKTLAELNFDERTLLFVQEKFFDDEN